MASFFPHTPTPLELGMQRFGSGISSGFLQKLQRQQQQQKQQADMQMLQNFLSGQQANQADPGFQQQLAGLTGQQPGSTPLPNFQTPGMQQAFMQQQLQQMLNPLQGQQAAADLANTQSSTEANRARAEASRRPLSPSVQQQLHDFALGQGFRPGTKKYDDVTRGLKNPTKETLTDFKLDLIKKKQNGEPVPGFENLTPADILKLDSTQITNTFNTGKLLTEGMVDRQSKKKAFLETANATLKLYKPELTGPVQGRWTWLKNRLAGGTKDSAKFEAGVASVLESMYQRAGKQLSDKEIEKWAPFLPKITDPDKTFEGKWENLTDNVSSYLANEENLAHLAGYAVPGQQAATANPLTPQEEARRQELMGRQ